MSVTVEKDNYSKIDKEKLLPLLAEAEGVDYLDLSEYTIPDKSVPYILGERISRKFDMLALEKNDNTLLLAMKDPKNIFAIDSATLITSLDIKPVMVDPDLLKSLMDEVFYTQTQPQEQHEEEQVVVTPTAEEKKAKGKRTETEKKTAGASIYKQKLGSILVSSGVITEEQLEQALEIQKEKGEMIGSILIDEGFITKEQLYQALQEQIGIQYIDLKDVEIPEDILLLVDKKLAKSYNLIPVKAEGESLYVAMSDPANIYAIDDLRLSTGYEIIPFLADRDVISEMIESLYPFEVIPEEPKADELEVLDIETELEKVKEEIEIEVKKEEQSEKTINISDVENAPIVRLVNMIFKSAIDKRASDIHIEAYEDCVMIRLRIDGQLTEFMKQDKKIQQILVARIKIISGLDIAEKRVPQDGRVALRINNRDYDFRVSTLPTMFGEKVVIRVLDKEGFNRSKTELGLFEDDLVKFDSILAHPYGIVLVTGPTGSGKSTTLYTALRELSKPNVNILTVEDPVESTIRGINQVQVNVKAGMTFASALRAFLRQDPDIIMVGEIRDRETAEIAIRAAITGHLVLSTLHTNDSVSSINRLVDMGVEPFLIASSLVGVLAQRLVRRLCNACKEEYTAKEHEMRILKINEERKIYKPVGCPECNNTGYKGRIAAYEILTITSEMRDMISRGATTEELFQLALKNGMRTLADSCSRLVLNGITSLEEMVSVVSLSE